MTPIPGTPRRRVGRSSVRPRTQSENLAAPDSAPPSKRRKYVPGGPGGGGRFIDPEGNTQPVGGTGPGGYAYTGPRGRVGRMNLENGVVPPSPSTARTATYSRPRRERPPARPRYSSAAAAAQAAAQADGYKPREERSWEEFHPDLDIEADFMVFRADEVDGTSAGEIKPSGPRDGLDQTGEVASASRASSTMDDTLPPMLTTEVTSGSLLSGDAKQQAPNGTVTTPKRRPGRPLRRPESMLHGLGSPPAPRITPLPAHNPKERLNLPKPSFRKVDPFTSYEQDRSVQVNYVDRTMANVGYQESDRFEAPQKTLIRMSENFLEEDLENALSLESDGNIDQVPAGVVGRVEYDMDEQDDKWLETLNAHRKEEQVEAIKPSIFEITMTQIEKEYYALEKRVPKPSPKPPQTHRPRSSSAAAVNGEPGPGEEQDTKCAICDDGDCENTNAIVFCDGCDLAVHQECYGVPFIPEGQWLCRKCQLIGRGTPTCIFCPNTDGAFKQTNTLRWSHLLCAIWIPEVSLGNTTFMEPVMEVEKVPKQRWRLTCYICHQKMGACIQCGNKNCYQAFHVTCARRARLFLKMKSNHGVPGIQDASVLKAFCDKHVPQDWRREHDVEVATADAKEFYRYSMRGRRWADSQQSALAVTTSQPAAVSEPLEEVTQVDDAQGTNAMGVNKRKRSQLRKTGSRLPSGAPVVPHVVFTAVETSLQRFTIRKRKDYVAEACKYWTLKREARRGAALLKRLQLQMESFSSMEIARRNFAGMGAAGRPRLQRRIEFADQLQEDISQLRALCDMVKERELQKLRDVDLLREIVDTVYFPVPGLLWPILTRAQKLDEKTGAFKAGFANIQRKLEERFYTSVSTFSTDFISVISSVVGLVASDAVEVHNQLNEVLPGTAAHSGLTTEQKELKRLAKRIIKAIQGPLEDATRKEAELSGKPFEKELRDLDAILENSMRSRRESLAASALENGPEAVNREMLDRGKTPNSTESHPSKEEGSDDNGTKPPVVKSGDSNLVASQLNGWGKNGDVHMTDADAAPDAKPRMVDETTDEAVIHLQLDSHQTVAIPNGNISEGRSTESRGAASSHRSIQVTNSEPLTPPTSEKEKDLQDLLAHGGIPWYLEPFDPIGTTIHDERWTGREVLRGMSEELSEIDDDTLQDLEDAGMEDVKARGDGGHVVEEVDDGEKAAAERQKKKLAAKRKAARNRWG
ncbi:hypothetical protein LTR16_000115 [Cryomyces antarcticus]|uniref:PHD-type domain-containing protein n=1 Tax=Cryomyces antarcticus TaxID=329879 RepID=A0ABR0M1T3_9PEZI|nr:hypothetical protein LTR16_000115 [Cryomyces antarcticus]